MFNSSCFLFILQQLSNYKNEMIVLPLLMHHQQMNIFVKDTMVFSSKGRAITPHSMNALAE
jgi:hypothetical protein